MKMTYVGHAKALFEVDGIRLITDPSYSEPLYCNTLWHYPPLAIGLDDLPPLDFIYVSHHHRDHFDPPSLRRLNKSAVLIVPALDEGWGPMHSTGARDRFQNAIDRLGFETVHRLRAWESLELTPNVKVTMVPAHTNEPDSSLVLETEGQTIFLQNDNYLGDAVRAELARRFPRIDVGMMFWGASVGYPASADLPEEVKLREAHRRKHEYYFPMARETLAVLRPRLFVPFANDLSWLAPQEVWINRLCRIHPGHLAEYWEMNAVPGVTLMQMNSGDTWTPATGLHRLEPAPDWSSFFDALERYAGAIAPQIAPIFERERAVDTVGLRELWRTRMGAAGEATRAAARTVGSLTVYFRIEGARPYDFALTFGDNGVTVLDDGPPPEWNLRISVDDFLLVQALRGEIEFQEIRNTRWKVAHPNGYSEQIRRFWTWLCIEVDNYLAEQSGAAGEPALETAQRTASARVGLAGDYA